MEMWTPSWRCTPAHARQTTTPRLIDAHAGLGAPQSAHASLPSVARTRPHTELATEVAERPSVHDGVRTPIPRVAAVAFCITWSQIAISSCDCAWRVSVVCGEIASKQYGTLICRASFTLSIASGSTTVCATRHGKNSSRLSCRRRAAAAAAAAAAPD